MKRIILFWNGMATTQVSGGDMYIKKVIELSGHEFDAVLSGSALGIVGDRVNLKKVHVTDNTLAKNMVALALLYLLRTCKAVLIVVFRTGRVSTALATSPFFYDLLPAILTRSDKKAVILFHLIPERKGKNFATKLRFALAGVEQKISLVLIRVWVDTLLVGNDELKEQLEARFPKKRIVVAHAGIDTQKIDSYDQTVQKDPNLALFVGRLTTQKGVFDLIDIAKKVEAINPSFRFKLVGDGPDRQRLERIMKEKNIKNIELSGFVSEEEKYRLMAEAKYFVFPSYEEGWGIALAEALYMNCLGICYEISHYQGLFGSYPKYVKMGDWARMTEVLIDAQHDNVQTDQRAFMKRYDDRTVVRDVTDSLV
jgi:glycosyltransferase involved in cell wall biosynthesis